MLVHLLVPEVADAILTTDAKRILTMNLVPADETAGFSASAHLEVLAEHAPDPAPGHDRVRPDLRRG